MSDVQEAMDIEKRAWKVVSAFDDVAEVEGRFVAYAAMIMIMSSFCRTSHAPIVDILTDFCERVGAAAARPLEPRQ